MDKLGNAGGVHCHNGESAGGGFEQDNALSFDFGGRDKQGCRAVDFRQAILWRYKSGKVDALFNPQFLAQPDEVVFFTAITNDEEMCIRALKGWQTSFENAVNMFLGIETPNMEQEGNAQRQIPSMTRGSSIVGGKGRMECLQIDPVADGDGFNPGDGGQ